VTVARFDRASLQEPTVHLGGSRHVEAAASDTSTTIEHARNMASSNLDEANDIEVSKGDETPPPLAALFLIKFDLKVG
jgi:hypothetical protein